MCGIVAAYGPGAAELVSQALPILEHRGPDSQGSIELGPCALGMVRLAVLDPLPRADQPMSRGHINLVFNGEIYNFRQLRDELFDLGHVFETTSDTEVVLCAILQWGPGALSRLDGMFGLAWWDQEIDTLFAARDRFGIKPLYWRGTPDGGVELASEVRALQRNESEVSRKAIAEYLVFGSPISCTIFSDAHELMPGNLLTINGAALTVTSWLEPAAQCERGVTSPAMALQSAIASHLVADRKVGVFLSGGFDSAIVARGIRDAGASPLAITLDTGANAIEVAGAVRTAREYGLDHHVVTVQRDDLGRLAQDFITSQDQPTIDGFNTYLVSRA
ncbi:MAG: asparagine synthase-related protein, partial [Candidatus Nanopelagicales bacterium]